MSRTLSVSLQLFMCDGWLYEGYFYWVQREGTYGDVFFCDHCVLKIRLLTPAIVSKGVQRTRKKIQVILPSPPFPSVCALQSWAPWDRNT
jgi:hypothetical protein